MDNYTKSILTVIAACLVILTMNQVDLIPSARANGDEVRFNAEAKNYGIIPVNEDGSVSVRLDNLDEMKVDITGISTYDELNINLDEIGGGFVSSGGPIKMEMN